jgi:hypothetical protein
MTGVLYRPARLGVRHRFAVLALWAFNSPVHNVTVPHQSLTDNLTSTNTLTGAFQYLPEWIRTTYNPPGRPSLAGRPQPNDLTKRDD